MSRIFYGSGLVALTMAVAFFCLPGAGGQPPAKGKPAVPGKAAQAKALALVKEVYGDEYVKAAKDPVARAGLARTLLQEGRDTTDDLAARYVLFREARDLAADSGDVPTALLAVDEMAQNFRVPPLAVLDAKVTALAAASKATATPDAYQTVIDASLMLLDEALAADDYGTAKRLTATAEAAARKLKVVSLVRSVQKRTAEVERLQTAYSKVKTFADTLRKTPNDPKANLMIGRYQALTKGRWDVGLPLLAKGNDAVLQKLAAQDLAMRDSGAAPAQAALAEGWAHAAAEEKGMAKIQLLQRAYGWYLRAAAHADAKLRTKADAAMKVIAASIPPEYRVGEITGEVRRLDGHSGPVYSAKFGPDNRRIVSGGADTSLRLWDGRAGKELRRFDGNKGPVWTVAYAPDGRAVASGGFDRSIRLFDPISGAQVRELAGHDDYVRSVVFSRDGKWILSGGDDRLLRLWNRATGSEIRRFKGHDHFVWSVDLSHDGKRALSGSLDKTVRLWDVDTGSELLKLVGHKDTVLAVAFAPDGRRAISGSTDGTVKLWDLEAGQALRTMTGHKGYVQGVAFAPDGRRALSAGRDGTLRLWDVETGEEVRRLEGHTEQVWSVAFSPDGRWAVSAGNDGTVRVWGSTR